jgi:glycosyltransferase involved in cell wall biosynthesis
MPPPFTIIVLTHNEAVNIARLLHSVQGLGAPVFVVDSGSTDDTCQIALSYGASVIYHPFENHPKQWHFALSELPIESTWVICLDADQEVMPRLFNRLKQLVDVDLPEEVNGIYFNRHNYFKGKRLMYGGYRNKYLLKMFRYGIGHSDLSENMDHRFIVPGRTIVWKDGIVKEENQKENEISFWIAKHNRYSDLVAQEEIERRQGVRQLSIKPRLFGNADERIVFLKNIWWKLPLYIRPVIYFFFRFFVQLGILENREGRVFHFLHSFWFRLLVDIKISEHLKKNQTKT